MHLVDFIFRLGVLFAIYGFLWGIFELGIMLISAGRVRSLAEVYLIRGIKYFFLVDVTFLFCFDNTSMNMVELNRVIFAGIILLTYFIGKLQQNQNRSALFNIGAGMAGRGIPQRKTTFNFRAEITIISAALVAFSVFWFFPEFAINSIAEWFRESIINIEDTPVFGFIFKVVGFFFLISLIFKMVNTINFLLSGGRMNSGRDNYNKPKSLDNDDHFDDFEEI